MKELKYIIELKNNIDLYLKAKQRKQNSLTDEDKNYIFEKFDDFFSDKKYDYVFIPESSNDFIYSIAKKYFKEVIIIEKKKYNSDDLLKLFINIQDKNIEIEQKKSIIYKIIENFKEIIIKKDLCEYNDITEEITLSIHDFKSNQRKNIVEYIYDESDIRNIRNIIYCNNEKKFCLLDDFVKTGETINYLSNKIKEYIDFVDIDIISLFKETNIKD